MIPIRTIKTIPCEDDNTDTLQVIEGITFGTKIVDLKAVNKDMITHIFLTPKKAKELGESLLKWANQL